MDVKALLVILSFFVGIALLVIGARLITRSAIPEGTEYKKHFLNIILGLWLLIVGFYMLIGMPGILI